jgi:excisionase family DNA binding protein
MSAAPTMRLEEAAKMLCVHKDTLAGMARAGTVPAYKVGRAWVFSTRLLQEWLDTRCKATGVEKARAFQGSASASLAERLAARLAQANAGKQSAEKRREAARGDDAVES